MAACRDYPGVNNARRITFEYVMLKGVNDSPADARALVRLLEGHPGQGQPDPVQPVAGRALRMLDRRRPSPPSPTIVFDAGYAAPVRTPRGHDIMAACGQLKSASVKQRASARVATATAT